MSTCKVSVIVPSYNQASYLEKTIDSLQAQTFTDLEIIVVDDGSSELATYELLHKLENLPQIKVIRQANFGVATARNNGFLASSGKYIQFVDGDDFLDVQKIEKQVKQLEEKPTLDISLTDYYLTDSCGKRKWSDNTPKFSDFNLNLADFLYKWDRGILSIPIHCALFRRTIMPEVPFIDGMYAHEDWVFWVTLAFKNAQFSLIEEPLAYYRIHEKSSTKDPIKMGLSWLRATNEIIKRVSDLPDEFSDESLKHYHRNYLPQILKKSSTSYNFSHEFLIGQKRYSIRNPLVSVIMPCYNSTRTEQKKCYLDMAINSILHQSYANWELVAVNDGSSDGTLSYLLEWSKKDNRIKVLDLPANVGVAEALNAGANYAKGKYVARMDDDDISSPRRFEYQVELLEQQPDTDIVGSAAYIIDENNVVTYKLFRCESHDTSVRLAVGGDSPFIHGSVMMRKSTFCKLGGYNADQEWVWAEDYEFWFRFLSCGKGYNLNEPLYYYRDYAQSVSKAKAEKQKESALRIKERFIEHFAHVTKLEKGIVDKLAASLTELDKPNIRYIEKLSVENVNQIVSDIEIGDKSFAEAKNVLVSILVPTYNRPDYLKRNLDSIAMQDFEEYEVIITDDSPNNVLVPIIEAHPLRPKIKYYKNDSRLGSAGNWNKCAEYARGTFIKYLHHDDYFNSPTALTKLVKALEDDPAADFAFCISRHVNEGGRFLGLHTPSPSDLSRLAINYKLLLEGNCIGAPSVTFYRKKIHTNFDEPLKWFIDVDFYMMLLQQNPNFVFVPEPLVNVLIASDARVTSSCEGNFVVEIKEASFLWDKWDGRDVQEVAETGYFLELVDRCVQSGVRPDISLLDPREKDLYFFLMYRDYIRKPLLIVESASIASVVKQLLVLAGKKTLQHPNVKLLLDTVMPKGSRRREQAKRLKKKIRRSILGTCD